MIQADYGRLFAAFVWLLMGVAGLLGVGLALVVGYLIASVL